MNITLSIDERVADEARRAAQSMGMSLNQAVRAYLERLAGREQLEAELQAFKTSALRSRGKRRSWTFDRDELHERARPFRSAQPRSAKREGSSSNRA